MNARSYMSLAPYPALRIAGFFAVGIALSAVWSMPMIPVFAGLVVLLMITVVFHLLSPKFVTNEAVRRATQLLYILLLISVGFYWHQVEQNRPLPDYITLGESEREYILHGVVKESSKTARGFPRIRMKVDSLETEGYPVWNKPLKVEAYSYQSSGSQDLGFARRISVVVQLDSISAPRNPNQFDYQEFLHRRGIFLIASISQVIESEPVTNRGNWLYWQAEVRELIGKIFAEDQANLARAVLLGDRSGLEREAQTAFSRAGLAHLMAVSGMHVGFLMTPVWFVIPLFWRFNYGGVAAFGFSLLVLIAYAGITGFAISVVRASIMAALLMYARCFQKPSEGLNLLGAAALIMLIINPLNLFEVGFQLSFGAVLIILTTLPASREILPVKWRYTWGAKAYQFVMVSVLVQAGLYPILLHYFNEFSLIGPISNTIAVPFVQGMFTISMMNLGMALISPGLASALNQPSNWIILAMDSWVEFITGVDYTWVSGSLPGAWFFLLWACVIALFASLHLPQLRWKFCNLVLLMLVIAASGSLWQKWQPEHLKITVFDVGQADALLIQSPDGTNFFYDTGLQSFGHDSGRQILEPELRARGIDHIDAIIHSHPHADHIGGTAHVIEHFQVDEIYQPDFEYDSGVYHSMMEVAEANEVPVHMVERGDMIELTPELRLFVMAPHNRLTGNDPNTWSAVVKLQYGHTSVLLTGDATRQTEDFMIKDFGEFLQSDLLKVGHHGSRTSSTEEFLEYVAPEKSVASLEVESRFGHPHPEAARNLLKTDTRLRYTSLQGAVRYVSDGKELWHEPWR